jgi:hypothetical protein
MNKPARFALASCLALVALPALAGLGGAPTQAPATAAAPATARAMTAQRPVAYDGYTVNEIRTDAGGVIREYVSSAGVVFGISWRSPVMPDLHELLGDYFPAFEQSAVASRATGRRGPIAIDRADLVLQSAGQMRDYRGRAYVPGLLPANVDAGAIQ